MKTIKTWICCLVLITAAAASAYAASLSITDADTPVFYDSLRTNEGDGRVSR